MTAVRAPRWTAAAVGFVAAVLLALGLISVFRGQALFGMEAYRTTVRVPVGFFGVTAIGLGAAGLLAALTRSVDGLRTAALALLVATGLTPIILIYNIGAFNRFDTEGTLTLLLAVAVLLLLTAPCLLTLRVLHRLTRRTDRPTTPAEETDPAVKV